jgi:NTP pyrophosphatase (non-canonical NTP hydrolase)
MRRELNEVVSRFNTGVAISREEIETLVREVTDQVEKILNLERQLQDAEDIYNRANERYAKVSEEFGPMNERGFPQTLRQWAEYVWEQNEYLGWHDGRDRIDSFKDDALAICMKIANIHAELSEALEEVREGQLEIYYHDDNPKPEGFGIELVDAIIRIMDLAQSLGVDLQECFERKMAFNKTRGYRHGGKRV